MDEPMELSDRAKAQLAKTPEPLIGKKSHHKPRPPAAMDDRILQMFERFMERQSEKSDGLTADQFKEALTAVGEAQRKAMKPENVEGSFPPVSDFNPTGDFGKAKLRRKTFFVGAEMRNEFLNDREITLCNSITRSMEARKGRWTATVKRNGTSEELHILVPHKEASDRMDLPTSSGQSTGFELILRELIGGQAAVDPSLLADRVAALEAQLAGQGA